MNKINEGPFTYEKADGKIQCIAYDKSQNSDQFWAQGNPGAKPTESDQLNKCFEMLSNCKAKFPFLCYRADEEFIAIRCWHEKHPEVVFALTWGLIIIEKQNPTILDEETTESIEAFKVEYWDCEDADNDKVILKTRNRYDAVYTAVKEVILVDLENFDLNKAPQTGPDKIIRSPHGEGRREVEISKVYIPDLWGAAARVDNPVDREAILETWHLAHDLLDNLRGNI